MVAEYLRRQAPAGAVLCLEARKAETAQVRQGCHLVGSRQVCAPDYGPQQQLQEQEGLGPPALTVAELGRRLPTAPATQALLRHGWKAEAVVAVTDNRFDYLCLLETGTTRCVCLGWVQRRR